MSPLTKFWINITRSKEDKKDKQRQDTKTGQKENITLVILNICYCWETDHNTYKFFVQPFKIMESPFNILQISVILFHLYSNLALLKRKKHGLQMSHFYRLIIGPHKHVCNAIWANLDWFWRESNCLIVNRSFLCHLTYNLNISVLNLSFLNLSVCYGIWGQFRANTLCYFAHLCYFADLCTSANLIFLKLHFKCQQFPNIWRSRWKAATQIIWC